MIKKIHILILLLIPCIIFWQFFIKGLYPYPGNYQQAWYEPWKSDNFQNGVITVPHKPVAEDTFKQIYPFTVLSMEMLKGGQPPIWNPYNGAGMPLLATINIGFLDPHNLFYLFSSPQIAWSINVILPTVWISLFTYLYLNKLGISRLSSVFSSLAFVFSGFVIVRTLYAEYINAVSMLPLFFFLIESFIKNQKTKIILFLPVAIFTAIVSTQPQISMYVLGFSLVYFLFRIISERIKIEKKLKLAGYTLLGLCLTAIQLIPTYVLFKNSNMTSKSSEFIFEKFLLPFKHLITIIIPNFFGNPSTYNFFGKGGDYVETVAYIGIIPVFFALLSVFNKNQKIKKIKWFFVFLFFITIFTTIDWFLAKIYLSTSIPLITTGNPARIFLISTFSIIVLSSFGMDYLLKEKFIRRNIVLSLIFFTVVFISVMLYIQFSPFTESACITGFVANCRMVAIRNLSIELISFALTIITLTMFLKFKKNWILTIPLIILLFVGFYNSQKFLPFSSKESFNPKNELIEIIKEKSGNDQRVFGLGEANISTNFATSYRFLDPQYYHPLYIKRYGELVSFANEKPLLRSDVEILRDLKLSESSDLKRKRLFKLLGVNYLIYKKTQVDKREIEEEIVWENQKWILSKIGNNNRIQFFTTFLTIESDNKTLETLFNENYDSDNSVILNEKVTLKKNKLKSIGVNRIVKDDKTNIEIFSKNDSEGILLLKDNYYPGWKVFIDNKESKVIKANYNFKAVLLPKGEHKVNFVYDPWFFKIGALISITALSLYVFLLGLFLRERF